METATREATRMTLENMVRGRKDWVWKTGMCGDGSEWVESTRSSASVFIPFGGSVKNAGYNS